MAKSSSSEMKAEQSAIEGAKEGAEKESERARGGKKRRFWGSEMAKKRKSKAGRRG